MSKYFQKKSVDRMATAPRDTPKITVFKNNFRKTDLNSASFSIDPFYYNSMDAWYQAVRAEEDPYGLYDNEDLSPSNNQFATAKVAVQKDTPIITVFKNSFRKSYLDSDNFSVDPYFFRSMDDWYHSVRAEEDPYGLYDDDTSPNKQLRRELAEHVNGLPVATTTIYTTQSVNCGRAVNDSGQGHQGDESLESDSYYSPSYYETAKENPQRAQSLESGSPYSPPDVIQMPRNALAAVSGNHGYANTTGQAARRVAGCFRADGSPNHSPVDKENRVFSFNPIPPNPDALKDARIDFNYQEPAWEHATEECRVPSFNPMPENSGALRGAWVVDLNIKEVHDAKQKQYRTHTPPPPTSKALAFPKPFTPIIIRRNKKGNGHLSEAVKSVRATANNIRFEGCEDTPNHKRRHSPEPTHRSDERKRPRREEGETPDPRLFKPFAETAQDHIDRHLEWMRDQAYDFCRQPDKITLPHVIRDQHPITPPPPPHPQVSPIRPSEDEISPIDPDHPSPNPKTHTFLTTRRKDPPSPLPNLYKTYPGQFPALTQPFLTRNGRQTTVYTFPEPNCVHNANGPYTHTRMVTASPSQRLDYSARFKQGKWRKTTRREEEMFGDCEFKTNVAGGEECWKLRQREEKVRRARLHHEASQARLRGMSVGELRYYEGHMTVEECVEMGVCVCWERCACSAVCTRFPDMVCPCGEFIVMDSL